MPKMLLFALLFLNLIFFNNAFATVGLTAGGGCVVSDIYYYPEYNSIYYIHNSLSSYGGKYIMKYSLDKDWPVDVFGSIDDSDFNDLTYKKNLEQWEGVKGSGIPLREIKLNSLDITFEARLVDGDGFWDKDGKVKPETSFEFIDRGKTFKWEITPYYKGKMGKPGYAFSCFIPFDEARNKELDISFRGYAYPGGKFIFIVISTIELSFEFGYVAENVLCIKEAVLPEEIFLDKYSFFSSQEVSDGQVVSTKGSISQTLDAKQVGKYLTKISIQAYKEGSPLTGSLYAKAADCYLGNIKKPSVYSFSEADQKQYKKVFSKSYSYGRRENQFGDPFPQPRGDIKCNIVGDPGLTMGPSSLAVGNNNFYVNDPVNKEIKVFNLQGKQKFVIKIDHYEVINVAVDNDGNVYGYGHNLEKSDHVTFAKYSSTGELLGEIHFPFSDFNYYIGGGKLEVINGILYFDSIAVALVKGKFEQLKVSPVKPDEYHGLAQETLGPRGNIITLSIEEMVKDKYGLISHTKDTFVVIAEPSGKKRSFPLNINWDVILIIGEDREGNIYVEADKFKGKPPHESTERTIYKFDKNGLQIAVIKNVEGPGYVEPQQTDLCLNPQNGDLWQIIPDDKKVTINRWSTL